MSPAERMSRQPEVRATYRLQLRPEFGFDDAAAVAGYLRELGVSHAYASPYLQAAPGSTHGYDVVDHTRVNVELGGDDAHERMCAAFGANDLGQVLDIVPNHMAITPENTWWTDVLENGPASRYAAYFDVDWDPPESRLRNRVLLPVLGEHYGRVLEAGELRVERREGSLVVTYFDHWFPLAPPTYDAVLERVPSDDTLAFLARAFAALPSSDVTDVASRIARHRDKEILKRQLAAADVVAVDRAVEDLNADIDALDALLDRQNYRLAWWRAAKDELDYRRFFDITTLAGLRMEDELVFEDTHALILRWLVAGVLDGVRVDHPDGLRDPATYVCWLRERAPEAWIVLEKILEPGTTGGHHEELPPWPCDGTTGYDFLNRVTRVLNDPEGEAAFTKHYAAFTGEPVDFHEVAYEKKRLVVRDVLAADLLRLTNLFVQLCESERRYRDFTRPELHAVLREALACFPVYRTYVVPGDLVTPTDEEHIAVALKEVSARRPETDPELLEVLGRVLRGELHAPAAVELCLRFQQTSGPVMAKGVEDTAFYTCNRFVALNEVGGDPSRWSDGVDVFHDAMRDAWPRSMLASTTHDTKRSEDVRARLLVLAEIPDRFAEAAARWRDHNDRHWRIEPDRNLEWLLYQTLVGAHPLSTERAVQYVEKATREAKVHTSWTQPNDAYDDGVRAFVESILADPELTADLDAFVRPLVDAGHANSLAMQTLKLTAPGVPDIYQGTELWDLSLVDPDNRRPVDFAERRRLLAEGRHPKLRLTRAALAARPDGEYEPIGVTGGGARHVFGFTRGGRVATIVTRFPLTARERGGVGDVEVVLPEGPWTSALTGDTVPGGRDSAAAVLGELPVNVLVRET
ncbi:MAG: (1-_4)-alpha-D-glucan 1-alpha-D-glucosylmutase [Actinomycetota bacterium]|nr:(1->4)-alpha-D-glucan 1-alpha-D-glucosylmutase [Actinomycetota bacterium]